MVTLLKLGGGAITDKNKPFSPRIEVINQVSEEIAESKPKKLILGNGGGSFGHFVAKEYDIKNGIKNERHKKGFVLTQDAVARLNRFVIAALLDKGVNAISVQPSAFLMMKDGQISEVSLKPIKHLLDLDIIPVVYGDTVCDSTRGVSIASTEMLFNMLASNLEVDRVIMGTNVDGVYENINDFTSLIPEITSSSFEKLKLSFTSSQKYDVTGSMVHKLEQALELARMGIQIEIINITKPGILKKSLMGKRGLGTIIKA